MFARAAVLTSNRCLISPHKLGFLRVAQKRSLQSYRNAVKLHGSLSVSLPSVFSADLCFGDMALAGHALR